MTHPAAPPPPAADGPRPIRYRPPAEVVADARPHRLGPVAGSVAAATLACLMLGSQPLADWTAELPLSAASDRLVIVADAWNTACGELGLTRFAEAARALQRRIEALR